MNSIKRNSFDPKLFVKEHGLSEDGAKWLTLALDPFHDTSVTVQGFPDGFSGVSQTVVERATLTIQKPAATVGAWDAHIAINPNCVNYAQALGFTKSIGGPITITGGTNTISGHCDVRRVTAGERTYASSVGFAPAGLETESLPTSNNMIDQCKFRVLSCGVEIVNTTQPLYQSGSVTVYRMPNSVGYAQALSVTDGVHTRGPSVFRQALSPPGTVDEAIRIPGSRQWEARKGAYLTAIFNDTENSFTEMTNLPIAYAVQNQSTGVTTGTMVDYCTDVTSQMGISAVTSMDTVGAYFSNLSSESTLKVNFVRYIERIFPAFNSESVFMTGCASHDEKALELYFRMAPLIPSGVEVGMNPKGEYWDIILKIARAVAPSVDRYFFGNVPLTSQIVRNLTNKAKQQNNNKQLVKSQSTILAKPKQTRNKLK